VKAIPNEEERWAACMGVAKSASHLAVFIAKCSDFVQIPYEVAYRMALVLNFCMGVWKDGEEPDETTVAKYKKELSNQDIDDRFQVCFSFLYEEAKRRGWVEEKIRIKDHLDRNRKMRIPS